MPLVVFGDGMKNKSSVKFKGFRHGISDRIYKHLRLRERLGEVYLLDIDEFRTSKVCYSYGAMNLLNYRSPLRLIHQISICNNCNIFSNRDVMAAKNMFSICKNIWEGGERPPIFTRNIQSATANVVVPHFVGRT